MSQEIGASLPPPLRFEMGAHPSGEAAKATLLLTVDEDGSQRVAVLAPAEIVVRDGSRVGFRLHDGSAACANIERTGKAALWYVLDAAAYCIRGTVAKMPAQGPTQEASYYELEVTSVLRDFRPDAPMVSGPTYKRLI